MLAQQNVQFVQHVASDSFFLAFVRRIEENEKGLGGSSHRGRISSYHLKNVIMKN